ncbi:TRAP transporter substrate-binding protein [Nitratireductor indicus]|uniref:TRAP transporter substrate-binding protein n=1 Tax=Nitratireductor indicus TaxID=721133 RepID=UPI002875AB3C|nr:TRAP transporter substrate-binding protein [Nitratireductor indicus]MDS1138745.1 TRAP transporter substrate-binding protein [Nitratireductor indicus]
MIAYSLKALAAGAALALVTGSAMAQTKLDFSTPWPETNFQNVAANRFAEAVKEATGGSVEITVHKGSEIGVSASESLAAVENGIVQMGSVLLFLQAGEEPVLAMDTLPFLIRGQDEMKLFLEAASPLYDEIAERHNQKILYYVPWPSPGVYSREKISSAADMEGVRIRAFNPASFQFLTLLGAAPLEMPWGDVAPALAAGTIDGVATSTSSGVDGKLWDLTAFFSPMQWSTSSDAVTVNLDTWNALSPEEQTKIEELAAKMQDEFWALSAAEDETKGNTLAENGMTIVQPDDSLMTLMGESGRTMWDEFIERVPEAGPVIEAYTKAAGK